MFEDIIARTGGHPNVAWRGRFADACIELCSDGESQYLSYDANGVRILTSRPDREITFRLEASRNDWQELVTPNPRPGLQTLSAMRRAGRLKVTGDYVAFYQNLLPLELLFSSSRPRPAKSHNIPTKQLSIPSSVGTSI